MFNLTTKTSKTSYDMENYKTNPEVEALLKDFEEKYAAFDADSVKRWRHWELSRAENEHLEQRLEAAYKAQERAYDKLVELVGEEAAQEMVQPIKARY